MRKIRAFSQSKNGSQQADFLNSYNYQPENSLIMSPEISPRESTLEAITTKRTDFGLYPKLHSSRPLDLTDSLNPPTLSTPKTTTLSSIENSFLGQQKSIEVHLKQQQQPKSKAQPMEQINEQILTTRKNSLQYTSRIESKLISGQVEQNLTKTPNNLVGSTIQNQTASGNVNDQNEEITNPNYVHKSNNINREKQITFNMKNGLKQGLETLSQPLYSMTPNHLNSLNNSFDRKKQQDLYETKQNYQNNFDTFFAQALAINSFNKTPQDIFGQDQGNSYKPERMSLNDTSRIRKSRISSDINQMHQNYKGNTLNPLSIPLKIVQKSTHLSTLQRKTHRDGALPSLGNTSLVGGSGAAATGGRLLKIAQTVPISPSPQMNNNSNSPSNFYVGSHASQLSQGQDFNLNIVKYSINQRNQNIKHISLNSSFQRNNDAEISQRDQLKGEREKTKDTYSGVHNDLESNQNTLSPSSLGKIKEFQFENTNTNQSLDSNVRTQNITHLKNPKKPNFNLTQINTSNIVIADPTLSNSDNGTSNQSPTNTSPSSMISENQKLAIQKDREELYQKSEIYDSLQQNNKKMNLKSLIDQEILIQSSPTSQDSHDKQLQQAKGRSSSIDPTNSNKNQKNINLKIDLNKEISGIDLKVQNSESVTVSGLKNSQNHINLKITLNDGIQKQTTQDVNNISIIEENLFQRGDSLSLETDKPIENTLRINEHFQASEIMEESEEEDQILTPGKQFNSSREKMKLAKVKNSRIGNNNLQKFSNAYNPPSPNPNTLISGSDTPISEQSSKRQNSFSSTQTGNLKGNYNSNNNNLSSQTPERAESANNGKLSVLSNIVTSTSPSPSPCSPSSDQNLAKIDLKNKTFLNNKIDLAFFGRESVSSAPCDTPVDGLTSVVPTTYENRVDSVISYFEPGKITNVSPCPETPIPPNNSNNIQLNSEVDQHFPKLENNSFLSVNDQLPFKVETLIKIQTTIISFSKALRGQGGNLLQICKDYIDLTWNSQEFEAMEQIIKQDQVKKAIRTSLVLQRLSIIVIIHSFLDQKSLSANLAHLRNILQFVHLNFIAYIDLLTSKFPAISSILTIDLSSEYNSSQAPITKASIVKSMDHHLVNPASELQRLVPSQSDRMWLYCLKQVSSQNFFKQNKKHVNQSDLANQLQNNCEMLFNLYKSTSKGDKQFFTFLVNYHQGIDKIPVHRSYNILLDYFALYLTIKENTLGPGIRIPFLSVAPAPYLPDINPKRKFTLILDLDQTLVHYSDNNGGQFVVRPHALNFLFEMHKHYEIVIFTAAMPDYANWVLDNIDKNQYITHRLFRQHAIKNGNSFIQDISRTGRDLATEIIIDNVAENFQLQPENGIFIKPWFSDPHDTALVELTPLLKQIATQNVQDVREALRKLKEQMIDNITKGIDNPHLNLRLD